MIYFRIIVMVERWMKESWKTKEYVPFQKNKYNVTTKVFSNSRVM